MKRKRPERFQLVNAYDEIVRMSVREVMNNTDMCKCERCFLDTCAIVFNRGYTYFVNTREGELLKKIPDMNTGNRVQLMVQVMHALKLVRDFPHHGPDEAVDYVEDTYSHEDTDSVEDADSSEGPDTAAVVGDDG